MGLRNMFTAWRSEHGGILMRWDQMDADEKNAFYWWTLSKLLVKSIFVVILVSMVMQPWCEGTWYLHDEAQHFTHENLKLCFKRCDDNEVPCLQACTEYASTLYAQSPVEAQSTLDVPLAPLPSDVKPTAEAKPAPVQALPILEAPLAPPAPILAKPAPPAPVVKSLEELPPWAPLYTQPEAAYVTSRLGFSSYLNPPSPESQPAPPESQPKP
jgi:hypothetical protein